MLRKTGFLSMFLVLCTVFALVSCAMDKPYTIDGEIELAAESIREGISLSINNIPPETTRMFINFISWGETEEPADEKDLFSAFTDIRGDMLERVKAAGKIVYPFVENGHTYHIAVSCAINNQAEPEKWGFAECTAAEKGIYFNKGLELNLNEDKTAVTLSAEPVFSSELRYSPDKYRYGITIKKGEHWSIGVGDNKSDDTLTWNFEPQLTDEITASAYLESGDYSAYAAVYCNTVYDNLTWSVELAKSKEFIVTF